MWQKSQKEWILQLLDDPSETVQAQLLRYFSDHEDESIALLRDIAEHHRGTLSYYAKQYLDRLGVDNTVETFRRFIQSFSYELETGCWLLDRTVNPKVKFTEKSEVMDAMGVRALDLFVEPCSLKEKCRVINRVVFQEYGFEGSLEEFKNPLSSLVSHVIDTRRGIPLSLSIIYILVASRCGVELRPIGIPGRFMVGCYSEDKPFFIDVFEGGRFLSVADVLIFLETNRIQYDEGSLAPIPIGEVLSRSCRNLQNQYMAANDLKMADLFAGFVEEFDHAYKKANRTS